MRPTVRVELESVLSDGVDGLGDSPHEEAAATGRAMPMRTPRP
jgi:hypothetical protein